MRFWLLNPLGNTHDEGLCFLSHFVKRLEARSWCAYRDEPLAPFSPEDARIFLARGDTGVKRSSMIGNDPRMRVVSFEVKGLIERTARQVSSSCGPSRATTTAPALHGRAPAGRNVRSTAALRRRRRRLPLDTRPPWRIAAR